MTGAIWPGGNLAVADKPTGSRGAMVSKRFDIRRLLEAVEGAPPIDSVDVLGAELRRMVDAHHVSLLIANLSGKAVERLSHVTAGGSRTVTNQPLTRPGSRKYWRPHSRTGWC